MLCNTIAFPIFKRQHLIFCHKTIENLIYWKMKSCPLIVSHLMTLNTWCLQTSYWRTSRLPAWCPNTSLQHSPPASLMGFMGGSCQRGGYETFQYKYILHGFNFWFSLVEAIQHRGYDWQFVSLQQRTGGQIRHCDTLKIFQPVSEPSKQDQFLLLLLSI